MKRDKRSHRLRLQERLCMDTRSMRMPGDMALIYVNKRLAEQKYPEIAPRTYRKTLTRIGERTKERLGEAAMDFLPQHLDAIDRLNWVLEQEGRLFEANEGKPAEQQRNLTAIKETTEMLSQYHEATQRVVAQQAKTEESLKSASMV